MPGAPPAMRPADSLRGQVTLLLLSMVALVLVVAGTGAVAVVSLTDDVEVVVDDLRPTAYANIALRNDMDQAVADVRGWGLTRNWRFLREYKHAVQRAADHAERVRSLTAGDARLGSLAEAQAGAVQAWVTYVDARVDRGLRRGSTTYVVYGDAKFQRFLGLNEDLYSQVNQAADSRGDAAQDSSRDVVTFVAVVSVLGLGLMVLVGWRIVRRLRARLRDLEGAVARLAAGDLSARVSTDGPREIHAVASALNSLAEENQRAREMEEQVVTQLRRLDRAKDDFVSTVSHELRTPLTSIAGYVELFEDGFAGDLVPQQRAMLGAVSRNVGRLRSLIEDLLTLSLVEADAFHTTFDLVDLARVASEAARDVEPTAVRAHVRIQQRVPERAVLVRGDAGQLQRATLNLLSNGVKFSRPGSEVLVRVTERDGQAVLSVVDHGIGIPRDELPTVGTRFYRASNAVESEITGTGLGLRIVQTIAHNHGGRLELRSEEGHGTTTHLVVPLAGEQLLGNSRPLQEITEG